MAPLNMQIILCFLLVTRKKNINWRYLDTLVMQVCFIHVFEKNIFIIKHHQNHKYLNTFLNSALNAKSAFNGLWYFMSILVFDCFVCYPSVAFTYSALLVLDEGKSRKLLQTYANNKRFVDQLKCKNYLYLLPLSFLVGLWLVFSLAIILLPLPLKFYCCWSSGIQIYLKMTESLDLL